MATERIRGISCDDVDDFDSYYTPQLYEDVDFNMELVDVGDLFNCKLPSIHGDVERINCSSLNSAYPEEFNKDTKHKELRNVDCMWSGFNGANGGANNNNNNNGNGSSNSNNNNSSNSNSAASSYSESSAVPPSIVTGSTLIIKREPEDEDEEEAGNSENNNNSNNNNVSNSIGNSGFYINKPTTATISIPTTTMRRPRFAPISGFTSQSTTYNSYNNAEQHIPPGASLLRKSNMQHKQQQQQQQTQQQQKPPPPKRRISGFGPEAEFRHHVDLRACIVGSNNISLMNSADANYIDHISRELQNTSKERIDLTPYRMSMESQINDVLDVLSQQTQMHHAAAAEAAAAETYAVVVKTEADTLSPPASSECDSDDGDCSLVGSSCGSSASLDGNNRPYMRHSDHCYTRCNEMEANLETPSDSDEEIDVVSLTDKKLPTNPSDRDRRALQTKVAHKISSGARTLPPPRRGRYELPYTPASSSPVKSVATSRYPSPSSTPYQSGAAAAAGYSPESLSQSSTSSNGSSSGSECTTPLSATLLDGKSRKRYYMTDCSTSVYSVKSNKSISSAAAAKKSRMKKAPADELFSFPSSSSSSTSTSSSISQLKQQQSTLGASNINNSMLKRQFSVDEADTIEKRNLHNDMERQRRIGLKNLFEALKKQIPTIRDKERAPKVNILREAAKLCEQLTAEENELNVKRQLLKAQLKKRQELLARLRISKNAGE